MSDESNPSRRWLNRTVLGIGLASLFSDWSHEMATTVMPAFLATMGVAAFWVGLIEGVSDGFRWLVLTVCSKKDRVARAVATS